MKAYALGGLLRAREARERQALLVVAGKAGALRKAEDAWRSARQDTADFRASLREREAEKFRALGEGAPAEEWRRAREEVRRLLEALALLEQREASALLARMAAADDLAAARAAMLGRMRERMKLDAHRDQWSRKALRERGAAEEEESEP